MRGQRWWLGPAPLPRVDSPRCLAFGHRSGCKTKNMEQQTPAPWWPKAILLLATLLGLWWLVSVYGLGASEIQEHVAQAGALGPVVFFALYSLLAMLPVPKAVLSILGGTLFGMAGGLALSWTAAMVGACLSFVLARKLGAGAVSALTGGRLDKALEMLRGNGVSAVFSMRLIPVVPFTAINYGAGLANITFRDYFIGSAVGMIPGSVAYVAVGAYASTNLWVVGGAVSLLVLLVAVGAFYGRRYAHPYTQPRADRSS